MEERESVYDRARKRVEALKGFYNHLKVFIVANVLLIVAKLSLERWLTDIIEDPGAERWLDINIFLTPVLWGVGLLIHGIYVYRHKFTFVKRWEEKKLKELLEDEENNK